MNDMITTALLANLAAAEACLLTICPDDSERHPILTKDDETAINLAAHTCRRIRLDIMHYLGSMDTFNRTLIDMHYLDERNRNQEDE